MAKTTTETATRSLAQIIDDFVSFSDSGSLRFHQARLAFEYIAWTEGKEASDMKEVFAKEANVALRRAHEKELSVPGVTNLVNTWKYMSRANLDLNPETNPSIFDIAKNAFNLASQTFRGKDQNYVNPAIEAIKNGADASSTFKKQTDLLKKDKKNAQEEADVRRTERQADPNVAFDSIVATLGMITADNFAKLDAEKQSTLRDLITSISAVVASK